MKKQYLLLFLLISLWTVQPLVAQPALSDSSIFIPSFSIHYSYQLPSGDLAKRFGNNHNVGGDFMMKFKNNIMLGVEISYLFGTDVKNEEQYFQAIRNDHGYVIDGNGQYAEIHLFERGFTTYLLAGYQFNFLSHNLNSGPFIQAGIGFMQHYVRIENKNNTAPQVTGEYAKLYDRLSNGLSTTQTIGYRYMGNRNLLNFYIAFEFSQAWTQSRRSYNADDMMRNTDKNTDLLYGIKLAWIIPLYGRAPKDFYYY